MAPEAEKSAEGAEAFVRYFWDVHNYAYQTLETAPFESIVEDDCTFCASTLADLKNAASRNASISGSEVSLTVVAVPPGKVGSRVVVATVITQNEGVESHPDGTKETFPPIPATQSSIALQWTPSAQWVVHDISIDDTDATQ
ncbi:hypothetical protein Kisp01_01090 [Kineosporia sp. NBRC 101677]|nr:hypothetical protein Kisp01_01090 [Kineosporia sp. NBRC 101677]